MPIRSEKIQTIFIFTSLNFNRSGITEPPPTELDKLCEDIVGLMAIAKEERNAKKKTIKRQEEQTRKHKADQIRDHNFRYTIIPNKYLQLVKTINIMSYITHLHIYNTSDDIISIKTVIKR